MTRSTKGTETGNDGTHCWHEGRFGKKHLEGTDADREPALATMEPFLHTSS